LRLLPLQALPGGGVVPLQELPLHAPPGLSASDTMALVTVPGAAVVAVTPVKAAKRTAALRIDVPI
jgi:hypothetical protein